MSGTTVRSPSYPSMSLQAAVEATEKIEAKYRSAAVDREVAAKLIGFNSLHGNAARALAALASYGLVERAGKGMTRVTPRARNILHPTDDGMRAEALRAAADEPKLFQSIRDRFPGLEVPPEDGVRAHLNREGFNSSAIEPATRAFMETAQYLAEADVSENHRPMDHDDAESVPSSKKFGGASEGDLVQWESGGVLQFTTPMRVRWVSEDGGWIAVEGSDTGIPMADVIVEQTAPRSVPPIPPAAPQVEADDTRKAVFPVEGGDVTLIFPREISSEALQELDQYLSIFLKKERRKTDVPAS